MIYEIYAMFCFLMPCWIVSEANKKKLPEEDKGADYVVLRIIFCMYCFIAIAKVASIGTIWDLLAYGGLQGEVNIVPFSSEGAMTYALNVIMFMPLGFLLPFIWKQYRKLGKTVLTGAITSLAIELFQLFNNRSTDIDDLLMNTLGTVLGFYIFHFFDKRIIKGRFGFTGATKNDALLFILVGTIGTFILYDWRILTLYL